MKPPKPLGAVMRGLAAGAVGTLFMTAWQELSGNSNPRQKAMCPSRIHNPETLERRHQRPLRWRRELARACSTSRSPQSAYRC